MTVTRALRVVRSIGLVTVQDQGRVGMKRLGIPPGGPLAPSAFGRANEALGNDPRCAGIEVVGTLEVEADTDGIDLSVDGEPRRTLSRGERATVSSDGNRRVRNLAVRGGIDVPVVHGGRGTLLVASLGGHEGRVLRKGDVLAVGALTIGDLASETRAPEPREPYSATPRGTGQWGAARIVPGPDLEAFTDHAMDVLLGEGFSVSALADRTGVRLEGPAIPLVRGDRITRSGPMVRGAIEVSGDGHAIVLGPDHPVTGGYPVLAVIVAADVENVVAAPIGARVRFVCRVSTADVDRPASMRGQS